MRIASVITVACLAALVACSPKDPKNPKFVVASFKDGKITRADLAAKEGEFVARFGGKVEDLKPEQAAMLDWQVANGLILEKVIAKKATELKGKIQPAVDAKIAEAKKQFKGDEKEFQKQLADSGLTEKELADKIAQQEAIRYLMSQEKDAPAAVTEADAKSFYDNNKQFWNQEELYSVRYFAVPLPPKASPADKKQKMAIAEAARKRVVDGEDFEKVAKEVDSLDPRAGAVQQVPSSTFNPELGKSIKALKPGAISAVLENSGALLVFQLVSITPAKVVAFDEVKEMIIKRLQSQKEAPYFNRIIEKLRDEAKIQFNIADPSKELAKTAPTAAPSTPAPAPAPAPAPEKK